MRGPLAARREHPGNTAPAQPAVFAQAWAVGPDGAPVVLVAPPRLRSVPARTVRRHRRQLLPWAVLPAPLVIAAAGYGHGAALAAAGVTAAIAFIAARISRKRRRYATVCGVTATAWVYWAASQGFTGDFAVPAYLAMWAALSLPWWNRYRIRHHHKRPDGQAALPLEADDLLARLRERVCGAGKRLAGAVVTADGEVKGGRSFLFTLVPGHQDVTDVLAAAKTIASAAEVPLVRVIAEPAPGEHPDEDGPAHLARVTILGAQHAHRDIQEFSGMTLDRDTGLFDVGPYPDLEMAPARLYKADEHGTPMRAASGLTCGAPGSGKSRYVEHKLTEHLLSGLFRVFLLDGQGGASIPGLLDDVDWPAVRPDEWQRCLRAVAKLMFARTQVISSRRTGCWSTDLGPFVQVVLEEAHKPLRDPIVMRLVKVLLQEGEKAGIGVDLVTQFPSQVELGGSSGTVGANTLRSMATAGNVVLFRTGDSSSKGMAVGSVEVNPRLLPQRPGMCHPLGASMRTAPARALRVANPSEWAATATSPEFSDIDRVALGADYATRMERFAEHDAAPEAATLDLDVLARELAIVTGEALPALSTEAAKERTETRTAISACWDYISQHEAATRKELTDALGYSASAVDGAMAALIKTRKVRKSARGAWELCTASLHVLRPGEDDDEALAMGQG